MAAEAITVRSLVTGQTWTIPYTPYPELKDGDEFVRLPGQMPAKIDSLEGKRLGSVWFFPEEYPRAMQGGREIYRRCFKGNDVCLADEADCE